ncbi:MAG TPA: hypothetical protein VGJ82_19425 [Thermoanaerobaculia bacterium]
MENLDREVFRGAPENGVSPEQSLTESEAVSQVSPSDGWGKARTDWLEHAKTLLEIGGTGGAFMAAGYVAESAHDELLGVNFPINRTLTDYALTGGRFVIESVAKLWLHPWISIIGLLSIALALIVGSLVRLESHSLRVSIQTAGLVVLTLLFAWKAYRLDVPYIQMQDVLRHLPVTEPDENLKTTNGWLSFKQHDIWMKFLCTHIRSEVDKWTPLLEQQFPDCAGDAAGCAVFSSASIRDLLLPSAAHTCFSIEQEYVINFYATTFLLLVTILVVRSVPAQRKGQRNLPGECRAALRVFLLSIAIGSTVTIPYIYGKAIESTVLPAGRVCFESTDFAGQPKIELADALIVWADDKFVTVYRTDSFEFLHLSRMRVRYISASTASDIIRVFALWYCRRPGPAE